MIIKVTLLKKWITLTHNQKNSYKARTIDFFFQKNWMFLICWEEQLRLAPSRVFAVSICNRVACFAACQAFCRPALHGRHSAAFPFTVAAIFVCVFHLISPMRRDIRFAFVSGLVSLSARLLYCLVCSLSCRKPQANWKRKTSLILLHSGTTKMFGLRQ